MSNTLPNTIPNIVETAQKSLEKLEATFPELSHTEIFAELAVESAQAIVRLTNQVTLLQDIIAAMLGAK